MVGTSPDETSAQALVDANTKRLQQASKLSFTPFELHSCTPEQLILWAPKTWTQRLTWLMLMGMIGLCYFSIAGMIWLLFSRASGVGQILFLLVSMVAVYGVIKLMGFALDLEDVVGVEVDLTTLTVTMGRGRRMQKQAVVLADIHQLQATVGANRYRGSVRSWWWKLYAKTSDKPVYLGWLLAQTADDAGVRAAAEELAARLGTTLVMDADQQDDGPEIGDDR